MISVAAQNIKPLFSSSIFSMVDITDNSVRVAAVV